MNVLARVAACLVLVGGAAAAQKFEVRSGGAEWQQIDAKRSFTVFVEQEEFSPLDRMGRMIFAVQTGTGGPKLEALTVRWQVKQGETLVAQNTIPIAKGLADVGFSLAGLKPGRYDVTAELMNGQQAIEKGSAFFRLIEAKAPEQKGRIALNLPRGVPLKAGSYPVSGGVPFPKGALWSEKNVRVVKAEGTPVPAQVAVRARWGHTPETSIRWLGVEFAAENAPAWWPDRKDTRYFLEFGPDISSAAAPAKLMVKDTPDGVAVDTGALQFLVRKSGFNLLDQVRLGGKDVMKSTPRDGLYLVDHEGSTYRAANDKQVQVAVEEQNDLRAVIRVEGWYVKDGAAGAKANWTLPTDKLCKFITRIEAYAGKPYVRLLHTWVLTFDPNTVRLKDVGLSLPVEGCTSAEFGVEGGAPVRQTVGEKGVYLVQHLPDAFAVADGAGKELQAGKRSAGWMVAATKNGLVALGHRETWQRFPKELEALPDAVKLHIWPAHGRAHPDIDIVAPTEIHKMWFAHQGAEMNLAMPWSYYFAVAKGEDNPSTGIYKPAGMPMAGIHSSTLGTAITSDLLIQFADAARADETRDTAACFQTAPHLLPDPRWTCASLAMGYMAPYDPEKMRTAEDTLEDFAKGYWETQDSCGEYGMWIYRTWHHTFLEAPGKLEPYRLYNATHHYEAFMPWMLYARSGDPFYLMQGTANMRLLTDVQVIHYDDPTYPHKEFHFGQGRLIGSTKHTNGFNTWGGDHGTLAHLTCYNAMMAAYFLTGDLRWKEVVVDEWQKTLVSDRKNPEWAKADRTGFDSGPAKVQTIGREGARDVTNALGELIDLYAFTHDPRVLAIEAPLMDFFLNKFMRPWGFPMQNVLLYYGSEQARQQLREGIEAYRKTNGKVSWDEMKSLWYTHAPFDNFAIASIIDPKSNAHIDAWLAADVAGQRNRAAAMRKQTPRSLAFCSVPDFVAYLPRTLYAVANAGGDTSLSRLAANQPLPAGDMTLGGWVRCIVKKDQDQDFDIAILGKVQAGNSVQVKVCGPDNKVISETAVPAGAHAPFTIKVPRDGRTGQYVIFVKAADGKAEIGVPLTTLPEVYVTGYWWQHAQTRYFVRSKGEAPETISIQPHVGAAQAVSLDGQKELAGTVKGEMISFSVGPEGAWLITKARYVHPKAPVLLAYNPERWFLPSPEKMTLKP